jgi:sec-independent protein translocase protein TatC
MCMSDGKEMGVWDHVSELRSRLFKALLALVICTIASFTFSQYTINLLTVPIGGPEKLISIEVTENIGVFMRVSLLSGFILALPFMLYQAFAYISPGLFPNEKKWLLIAIPIATVLFIAGVAFAYFVMLPAALPFLTSFLVVQTTPRLSNYVDFVTNLMFWIGIAFETPLVVFALAKFGIVDARFLLKQWRYAIVIIAIMAAVITPTVDPVNMGLLMLPLFIIYLLSVLFAMFARPNKKNAEEEVS